jgi:molybdenum cofactor synthesis domain-containing protein
MKTVPVQDAVGMVLGHDLTRIVPGQYKGPAFRKGHVITTEDIPGLLDIGKENIYVLELDGHDMHEDDAALCLAEAVTGSGLTFSDPREGKISIKAAYDGLLKVNAAAMEEINHVQDIMLASAHNNRSVKLGETVAGTRAIPLVVARNSVTHAVHAARMAFPVLEVKPFRTRNVGLVVTGSEVCKGRITDQFGPVIAEKLAAFGCGVMHKQIVPDCRDDIVKAIRGAVSRGMEMVVVTGGMSVDPDDKTPGAIRQTGAEVVTYGTPVLPGSMLMLAYLEQIPVFGLPGCVMYAKATAFDLLLPRVLADEKITRTDILRLGHGGLCLGCGECRYPNCSFGRV